VFTDKFNKGVLSNYGKILDKVIPQPPTLTATTITPASCGLNNGSVKLSATGGTPPYQYSKDGTIFQNLDTFEALAIGKYTFYVKDSKGEKATTTVEVKGSLEGEEQAVIILANARITSYDLGEITVQWDSKSTAYKYKFIKGFKGSYKGNILEITEVPDGTMVTLGKYKGIFNAQNHNEFLGFYKEDYTGICKPLGISLTKNKVCQILCKEGFLPNEIFGISLKLLVTDEEVGYTLIRVFDYGTALTKVTTFTSLFQNPIQPAYSAKVYKCTLALFKNNVISEKLYSFAVTLDAWQWAGDVNDNQLYILNRAFEPDGQIDFDGVDYTYPNEVHGYIQLPAFKLFLNNDVILPAKPLERTTLYNSLEPIGEPRSNLNEATNVMVHIGGHYTRGFMDWLGGSLGCFGFVESKDVKKSESEAIIAHEKDIFDDDMSNREWQKAVDTIHEYEKKYHLKLKITVFPRENYLKSFNLNKDKILWE